MPGSVVEQEVKKHEEDLLFEREAKRLLRNQDTTTKKAWRADECTGVTRVAISK